jgi:hypothetical protein
MVLLIGVVLQSQELHEERNKIQNREYIKKVIKMEL